MEASNLGKTRFAILQINTEEGPQYDSPIYLQLIESPNGPYLKAAPLDTVRALIRQAGSGAAAMDKVVTHLYENREKLFPDPSNHKYLEEKLTKKLISFCEHRHYNKNNSAIQKITFLLDYLTPFNEKFEKALTNKDSKTVGRLINSPEGKNNLPYIKQLAADQPQLFAALPPDSLRSARARAITDNNVEVLQFLFSLNTSEEAINEYYNDLSNTLVNKGFDEVKTFMQALPSTIKDAVLTNAAENPDSTFRIFFRLVDQPFLSKEIVDILLNELSNDKFSFVAQGMVNQNLEENDNDPTINCINIFREEKLNILLDKLVNNDKIEVFLKGLINNLSKITNTNNLLFFNKEDFSFPKQ